MIRGTYDTEEEANAAINAYFEEQDQKEAAERERRIQAAKDYNNSTVGTIRAVGSLLLLAFILLAVWKAFEKKK